MEEKTYISGAKLNWKEIQSICLLKAIPDEKCEAKKSMKRKVRRASPPKTGEDQEQEACKDKKSTKCVAISHFHYVSPMIICSAMHPREIRPSKAWGE